MKREEAVRPMNEAMLAPIVGDAPCGPDLEYDEDFLQLQQCAAGRPEEQYGATVIAARAPDWARVEALGTALFARTKDLRVLAELAGAWVRAHGLPGYAQALRLAASLLSRYWDSVHPQLAIDDFSDPMPRVNALNALICPQGAARFARDCLLIGALTVKEADAALEVRDTTGASDRLLHELRAAFDQGDATVRAAFDALDALADIRAIVRDKLGDEWSIEESAFEGALAHLRKSIAEGQVDASRKQPAPGATADGSPNAVALQAPSADASAWRTMQISSRADVDLGLEQMCRYFEQHEPSHPAPIFLRRAQRLLALNFYEIIRDIAPDSLHQLEMLSGRPADGERRLTEET